MSKCVALAMGTRTREIRNDVHDNTIYDLERARESSTKGSTQSFDEVEREQQLWNTSRRIEVLQQSLANTLSRSVRTVFR